MEISPKENFYPIIKVPDGYLKDRNGLPVVSSSLKINTPNNDIIFPSIPTPIQSLEPKMKWGDSFFTKFGAVFMLYLVACVFGLYEYYSDGDSWVTNSTHHFIFLSFLGVLAAYYAFKVFVFNYHTRYKNYIKAVNLYEFNVNRFVEEINSLKGDLRSKRDEWHIALNRFNKGINECINESIKLRTEKDSTRKYQLEAVKIQTLNSRPFKYSGSEYNTRGVSENLFYTALQSAFGDKIYINQCLEGTWYHPDFVYYDDTWGLKVDIEIDEPYILNRNTPQAIHFDDSARDSEFLSCGWFIVRFAEEQIINDCAKCILYFQEFIKYIQMERETLSGVHSPISVQRWTKEMAEEMAQNRYREKYLTPQNNVTTTIHWWD